MKARTPKRARSNILMDEIEKSLAMHFTPRHSGATNDLLTLIRSKIETRKGACTLSHDHDSAMSEPCEFLD